MTVLDGHNHIAYRERLADTCEHVESHAADVGYGDPQPYDVTCDARGVTLISFTSQHDGTAHRVITCASHAEMYR